jgi:NADP-dependent 3-hydroxy acid dehydrogenase YdfG
MSEFSDRVAVVTGASSGIGKAIAHALAAKGATVCAIGRDLDRLQAAATELPDRSNIFNYQADLQVDADLHRLVAELTTDHERIDFPIHSAGIILLGNIETAKVFARSTDSARRCGQNCTTIIDNIAYSRNHRC